MIRLAVLAAVLLTALAVASWGGDAPPPAQSGKGHGNVLLYVSNQSFERDTVDIRIEVDGREVVSEDFAVEDQHNWIEFRLDLAPGKHSLRAASTGGDATLERSFVTGERPTWAVVDYWCCEDGALFTLNVSDEPIAFA